MNTTTTYDTIQARYNALLAAQECRQRDRMNALCTLLDGWPSARWGAACQAVGAAVDALRQAQRRERSLLLARKYRHLDQPLVAAAMRSGFRLVA